MESKRVDVHRRGGPSSSECKDGQRREEERGEGVAERRWQSECTRTKLLLHLLQLLQRIRLRLRRLLLLALRLRPLQCPVPLPLKLLLHRLLPLDLLL